MKKSLVLVLAGILCTLAACDSPDAPNKVKDFTTDNLSYHVISGDSCAFVGGQIFPAEVTIPSTISFKGITYQVVEISDEAFKGSLINSVKLPSSIYKIGNKAFEGCDNLTTVDLSEATGLKILGSEAFANCSSLSTLYLGVTQIATLEERTFANDSQLTTVTFPESLTEINENVFTNCNSLSLINLYPYSMTESRDMGIPQSRMGDVTVIVPDDVVPDYEKNSYWSKFNIVSEEFETLNYLVHTINFKIGEQAYLYVGESLYKSISFNTSSGGYYAFNNLKITNYGTLASATDQSIVVNATNTFNSTLSLATTGMDPERGYVVEGTFYTKDHFNKDIKKTVYFYLYFSNFKKDVDYVGYYDPTTMHFQRYRK